MNRSSRILASTRQSLTAPPSGVSMLLIMRSADRELFPGSWDVIGGHVERNETLFAALEREILEETGWQLSELRALLHVHDWSVESGAEEGGRREFDFLVSVKGDLTTPRLERGMVEEAR